MKKYIILASTSRKRSQILSSCSIRHKIFKPNIREHIQQGKSTPRLVMINAKNKAGYAAKFYKSHVILSADTLTLLNGKIIGKPKNRKEALKILKASSGKKLLVYTGLYILDSKRKRAAGNYDKTEIKVSKMSPKQIKRYFKLLGPYDKAGGFSIEGIGAILFDNIKGSYFNVLGLPMVKLCQLFNKIGYDILEFINRP